MVIPFGLLLLTGLAGSADRAPALVVHAVIDSPLAGNEYVGPQAHLFGGREARLAVQVSAQSPGRIEVRARLVQIGSGLTAPHGDAFDVAVDEEIGPTPRRFTLRLTPPQVRRVSDLEVHFSCRSSVADTWLPAGRLPLRIYPADLLQPLRTMCQTRSLMVLDSEGRLGEFLRAAEVPFVDLSTSLAGIAPSRLPAGVSANSGPERAVAIWVRPEQPEHRGPRRTIERLFGMAGTVIVLGSFSNEHPGMKLIRAGDRTRLDLEMPIPPSLAADPRSQQLLVDAVLMSISPEDPILFDPKGSHP